MPHVESLSLFKAEEPQDKAAVLSNLGLTSIHPSPPQIVQQDVSMTDSLTTSPSDNYATQNLQGSTLPPREPKEQLSVIPAKPPPLPTKRSDILEEARSTIALRNTIEPLNMVSNTNNKGGPSTIVPNPVLFSKEDHQDEDEEMPLIDIDSDSEDEGTD